MTPSYSLEEIVRRKVAAGYAIQRDSEWEQQQQESIQINDLSNSVFLEILSEAITEILSEVQ